MSKDYHSKGQTAGKQGKYRPPHEKSVLEIIISPHSKKECSDIKAYRSGWQNARKNKN